jgi:hypothetical protein
VKTLYRSSPIKIGFIGPLQGGNNVSELSYVILVHKGELSKIQNQIKRRKIKAFIFPLEDWACIALKVPMELNIEISKQLSYLLNTRVCSYLYSEDYFFEYAFFEDGVERAILNVRFDALSNLDKANFQYIKEIAEYPQFIDELFACINTQQAFLSAHLFQKAFKWEEDLGGASYESIREYTNLNPNDSRFISIPPKEKPKHVEYILDIFGKALIPQGFTYAPDYMTYSDTEYVFTKTMNGFLYGIKLQKMDTRKGYGIEYIFPSICNTEHAAYHERGLLFMIEYKSDKELKEQLLSLTQDVITKGLKFLQAKEINVFDVNTVYCKVLDPFFEAYGFHKEFISPSLLYGGEVIYENNGKRVTYKQPQDKTTIYIEIQDKDVTLPLEQCLSIYAGKYQIYNYQRTLGLQLEFYFTNAEELEATLNQSIKAVRLLLSD